MKRALLALGLLSISGLAVAMGPAGCGSSSGGGGGGGTDAGTDGKTGTDSGSSTGDSGTPLDTGSAVVDSGSAGDGCVAPYDAAAYANSTCGLPGQQGNSLGVGQFCVTSSDCTCNSQATTCSSLGNGMPGVPPTYFCFSFCMPVDGGGDAGCGPNAQCFCEGANCVCTPDSCLSGGGDGGTEQ
jgi:hypothetical protein